MLKRNANKIKFILCGSILSLIIILGYSQNKKDVLYSKRNEIIKEIEYTTKLLNNTSKKKDKTIQKIRLLDNKIEKRKKLINLYKDEIKKLEYRINEKENRIDRLTIALENQKKLYADFVYYAYKNHNNYTSAIYLLASETLNQFYLRKKYLEQLGEARKKKVEIISSIKKTINYEINELVNSKNKKNKSLVALNSEQKEYTKERKERKRRVGELSKEEKELRKEIRNKKRIEAEIAKKIEEIIAEEAKRNNYAVLTPEQQLISNNFESNKGRLPWPTRQGLITEKFGKHTHPIIPNVEVFNSGIDISTINNEKVRAIFDGVVSKIFSIKGANYTVIMRHGAYYSVYHNLVQIEVNVGDNIKTKDIIGKVSKEINGGNSIVHLEIWKGLEKLDPEKWISK